MSPLRRFASHCICLIALEICVGISLGNQLPKITYCTISNSNDSDSECEPGEFGPEVVESFGNVTVDVQNDSFLETLVLKCQAPYAIAWVAESPSATMHLLSDNETNRFDLLSFDENHRYLPGTLFTFTVQVRINWTVSDGNKSRVLRCEGLSNATRSTVVHVKVADTQTVVPASTERWSYFVMEERGSPSSTQFTVPCLGTEFFANKEYFRLVKRNRYSENLEPVIASQRRYETGNGFLVFQRPDFESVYECRFGEYIVAPMAPLRPERRVRANLSYVNGLAHTAGIYCDAGNGQNLGLTMGVCNSMIHCHLNWRPFAENLILSAGRNSGENEREIEWVSILGSQVSDMFSLPRQVKPKQNHGYLECSAILPRQDNHSRSDPWEYVLERDYMFTGLDNQRYLFKKGFPQTAIIKLTEHKGKRSGFHTFKCQISTFVLLENIHFVVQLGWTARTLMTVTKTNLPYGASIRRLRPNAEKAWVTWELDLKLEPLMTHVRCYAPWFNGSDWAEYNVMIEVDPGVNIGMWVGVGVAVTLAAVIFIGMGVLVVILWRKYSFAKNDGTLPKEYVQEFLFGLDQQNEAEPKDGATVETMAFRPDLKIKSDSLKIEKKVLGEGEYGIVHMGRHEDTPVAVKSCKGSVDMEYFKAFLREIKVMAYVGEHEHIVKFYGAVVDRIEDKICSAVIELSPLGNLHGYLRKHSDKYSAAGPNESGRSGEDKDLSQSTLLSFCKQIAKGMEFLVEKKVIHGDLATRNVLVFENDLVKITDFGLSRKLYCCTNYVKKKQAPLPWRWMALESLRYMEFSTASDVWSFGVTVWEIFSMARVPFSGITWNNEFADEIEAGLRLPKPQLCPQAIFDYLMQCWELSPQDRPTFSQLTGFFSMSFTEREDCAAPVPVPPVPLQPVPPPPVLLPSMGKGFRLTSLKRKPSGSGA